MVVLVKFSFTTKSIKKPQELKTNIEVELPQFKNNPNLANFYLWTREDPLFTSPDFNASRFQESIDALGIEEKAYLKQIKKDSSLFPIQFLNDLPLVSLAYQAFISNPTMESAKGLLSTYTKTQADYKSEEELFVKNIESNKEISQNSSYLGIKTLTNMNILLNDFKKLDGNSDALLKEIEDRKSCLTEGKGCRRPANFFEKPISSAVSPYNFSKKDILPRDLLKMYSLEDGASYTGPYIASTPCFGSSPYYLFYLVRGKDRGNFGETDKKLTIQTEKIATTNFYRKVREASESDKSLAEKGYSWVQQYETHIYMCADSSYKNTTASIDSLYQSKKDLIFEQILKIGGFDSSVREVLAEGKKAEDKFFNSEFPSEIDARNLAKEYTYVYKNIIIWANEPKYKEKKWFKKIFSERFKILDRNLNYERKLSNVNEIFAEPVGHLAGLKVKSKVYKINNSSYAYSFRNMYSLVYFPFSSSFYRLPEKLQYIDNSNSNSLNYNLYTTYQEALASFSPEQIKKWNVNLTSILEDDYAKFKKNNLKSGSAANK